VRLALRVLLATVLALGLVTAGFTLDIVWNDGAEDVCREDAPASTSGYSITWGWDRLGYVCDYGVTERRVGLTEAVQR
jgi:hypothetical protein